MAIFVTRTSIVAAPPSGDANPDGYANATQTLRSADFTTSGTTDGPFTTTGNSSAHDCVSWTYESAGSYDGSGCWRADLSINSDLTEGVESQLNSGMKWWPAAGNSVDEHEIITVSWIQYINQEFFDYAAAQDPYLSHSKIVDLRGWSADGTSADINTRQLIQANSVNFNDNSSYGPIGFNCPHGYYYALTNGGAGGRWTFDNVNTPVNLADYPDQWVWICGLFDCSASGERSILYVKPQGGSLMRSVERVATDECSFAGTYSFNNRGWNLRIDQGAYNSVLMAYWQNQRYIKTPRPYVKIDRVRCANGWLPPPW